METTKLNYYQNSSKKIMRSKQRLDRLKLRQLQNPCYQGQDFSPLFSSFFLFSILISFSFQAMAIHPQKQNNQKKKTDVYSVEKDNSQTTVRKMPAQVSQAPNWFLNLLTNDEEGILESMENQVKSWEASEEYAKNWNLESTGMYPTVKNEDKFYYLKRNYLKYFDKKLAGEVRKADEDSGLKKVGKVQEALRPSGQIKLSKKVNLKFKAQVLQGKATVFINNPYFHWAAEFQARGSVDVTVSKDLHELGVKTGLNYRSKDKMWEASINKQLTRSLSSTVSSAQDTHNMAFSHDSDRKVELNFIQPF